MYIKKYIINKKRRRIRNDVSVYAKLILRDKHKFFFLKNTYIIKRKERIR